MLREVVGRDSATPLLIELFGEARNLASERYDITAECSHVLQEGNAELVDFAADEHRDWSVGAHHRRFDLRPDPAEQGSCRRRLQQVHLLGDNLPERKEFGGFDGPVFLTDVNPEVIK